ncbi:glycosyltransferase family 4 protein [Dictyobacter formicarum]|uniref:Glycosyl transferase family 1 n=1 Tax=Dictyobacter formicarum TaxID=2778368 RepID=A0ABQ3V8V0_9CHLR|nr:glycosyltransferase family 4 protein [Dictyobacter formicarum]GHO82088.1 glycosyl transferase family 1 [Dictyobacter formicarum]
MRILFFTPQVPSRIQARSINLLKELSKEHDISLVSLLMDQNELTLLKEIEPYCVSIDLVPHSKWQICINRLRALPTRIPLNIASYRSVIIIQCLKEVIQRQRIDLIHAEVAAVVPALNTLREEIQVPVVYDAVNCSSWQLQQKLDTLHHPLKKWFTYSAWQRMRHFEQSALEQLEQIVIADASDRDRLGLLMGRWHNIKVVRNCVDIDYFKPRQSRPNHSNALVFCGHLDKCANVQAILHFCEHILPLIWQQKPETTLTIVGPNPPLAIQALEDDGRITVTGYVPDVRPYLDQATVALAPLLVASGPQFNILEALAMETPVVTTPRCSRALGTLHGQHLLVAEGPQSYAEAVLTLLNYPFLARALGEQGRKFVINHYSWASAVAVLNQLYAALPGISELYDAETPLPFIHNSHTEHIRKV